MDIKKEDIKGVMDKAESRWGNWVKYVIGAIVGALVAGGVITLSGCGLGVDGVKVTGDQGMLEIGVDKDGNVVVVGVPQVEQRKGK